ncbi:DNA methyltransferase [Candidatus Collinsella stercoripullorum]|uniref:DNA methyltransferase n=1 Tax=Candidatus Collinsella stercoripullorum TaxID=2838522 RepID=UPI0022E04FAF|nr:DNA methyltransferase [Candidatus Collinsella stercoripullorum]
MSLSYLPLWKQLTARGMTRGDLQEAIKASSATIAKLGKDEPVSMEVIERICETLNCEISDVISMHNDMGSSDSCRGSKTANCQDLIISDGEGYIDEVWEIPTKANTTYLTHGIYRYIGKFPPQVPREVLRRYAKPGMTVVDPMCGSGTTLVEASVAGCNAIGFDVNPVSLMISEVVATQYHYDKLAALASEISELMKKWTTDSIFFDPASIPAKTKVSLGKSEIYFSEEAKEKCENILAWISQIEEVPYRMFFHVALLAILRRVSSANVKKINVTVDHDKKVKDVYQEYGKQLNKMLDAEKESAGAWGDTELRVSQADARKLPLDDESVDIVIIHPPYLSNTAFSEMTMLQLAFLGIDHKQIWKKELKMRGSYLHETDGLRKYLIGWYRVLQEAFRVLKPGGICAIENGDGQIDYVRIPVGAITREYVQDIGFEIKTHAVHKMNNNTGWTLSHRMKDQHIIIMEKKNGNA